MKSETSQMIYVDEVAFYRRPPSLLARVKARLTCRVVGHEWQEDVMRYDGRALCTRCNYDRVIDRFDWQPWSLASDWWHTKNDFRMWWERSRINRALWRARNLIERACGKSDDVPF